jgi:hypothetical protein
MWRVVALGIVNAGKSFVLSALADQRGLFPDGELPRMTRVVQQHPVGRLILVDTPGLDAADAESKLALSEAATADTVLWCHSLRMGELHAAELAALDRLRAHSGAIRKTCFVLTHQDDVASEGIIHDVSTRIAKQLKAVFSLRFRRTGKPPAELKAGKRRRRSLNVVGVGAYWRAYDFHGQQREYLQGVSGIPHLRTFLEHLARKRAEKE